MSAIDVFNGDADGICALTQLRNAEPTDSLLVTGVKRDIALLERVDAKAGDSVTVLDVSLDKNRDGLEKVLAAGAKVFYADHHFAGEIPTSPRLEVHIDTSPDICTSLLIDRHLEGKFALWAVTGAFGDNLEASAQERAKSLGISADEVEQLRELGNYINYNGYGASLDDLHFPPADLFEKVHRFASPLDFIAADADTFGRLSAGYRDDMAAAAALQPTRESDCTALFILPDERWARRVSGVYSNQLANGSPARGHAVLTERADGTYLVSVRAPLDNKVGADELCRRFPTGGGRKAAAGINALPTEQLDDFIEQFTAFYDTSAR
ncbi:MAG: DHH family phosphoesterase [Deltaproteobacteria bacterium]|nr:DHH family phosphoesterase [Deltaproteobacteria bacterium]MBW2397845.1 DHH family phosphoesterase [Deltaproteobacteria bacterium]